MTFTREEYRLMREQRAKRIAPVGDLKTEAARVRKDVFRLHTTTKPNTRAETTRNTETLRTKKSARALVQRHKNRLTPDGKFRDPSGEYFLGSVGNPGFNKPRRILCYKTNGGIVGASARFNKMEAKENALAADRKKREVGKLRSLRDPFEKDTLAAELEAALPGVAIVVKKPVEKMARSVGIPMDPIAEPEITVEQLRDTYEKLVSVGGDHGYLRHLASQIANLEEAN